MSESDLEPPDNRIILQLNKICRFVGTHCDAVLDKIYEHYRLYVDSESFDADYLPGNLGRDQIAPHLHGLSILVHRRAEAYIGIDAPDWEVEHGVTLTLKGSRLEFQEW